MTQAGYRLLQEEAQRLKFHERPRLSKMIEVARAHGDLSENAEYDAAKEAQGICEARIRDIEHRLASAQVVDLAKLSGSKVVFGATVEVEDLDTSDRRVVSIVGEHEADAERGLISYGSPLARALIGKRVEDVVQVTLPAGQKDYEIMKITFIELEIRYPRSDS